MSKLIFLLAITALTGAAVNCFAEEQPPVAKAPTLSSGKPKSVDEKNIRVDLLAEAKVTPKDNPVNNLVATVEVAQVQIAASGGIRLTVDISNPGDQDIVIHNPLDGLGVLLTISDGWVQKLPPYLPRGLICSNSAEERDKIRLPYKVNVVLDGASLTKTQMEAQTFRLPAGRHFLIHAELDQIMGIPEYQPVQAAKATPVRPAPNQSPSPYQLIKTPPGACRVQVSQLISQPPTGAGALRLRRVESEFIEVTLK